MHHYIVVSRLVSFIRNFLQLLYANINFYPFF